MNARCLDTRLAGHTLWVELRHPPVNFLTADICAELYEVFRAAETNDAVRVMVLTGGIEDRYIFHFSIPELQRISADNRKIGLDRIVATRIGRWLVERSSALTLWLMDRSPGFERLLLRLTRRMRVRCSTLFLWVQMMAAYKAIERSSRITIAAINGTCNGGGTEMAACFDFRFMVEDGGFTLGQPEVLVGIIAGGGGSQRWPRLIGKAKALEFMLCCDQWTPQTAKQHGLITDHFPKDGFRERVQEIADRLCRRSPIAAAATKEAVRRGLETGLDHALAIEMAATVRCCADGGTQRVMQEYARILDEHICKASTPATVGALLPLVEADDVTRHFFDQDAKR